ncbi:hypothetical protein Fcan01_15864 [Folsomia candida]|uniref:Uncharacterized protein n=1 Tax=Folsomia candida TaxID=158441 RepID=A0A226DWG1_FOLCA|nr:hypothetical protein Fcan01_15864 [Folsomia candida]
MLTFLTSKQPFEASTVMEEEAKKANRKYHLPHLNSSIENQVVSCGKSVLIREIADMEAEMQFFKKHYWIEFNKGDETLGSEPYGISFDKEGDSNIPRNFKSLHETGIVPWIEAKFHASKFAGRKPIANERKEINPYIKIEGGIGTVRFYGHYGGGGSI